MNKLTKSFLFCAFMGLSSSLSVVFFWQQKLILTLILIFISIFILASKWSLANLLLYILCSIGGAIAEAIVIVSGTWQYTSPHFMGIPYWLPFLWGITALFIINFKKFLDLLVQKF